MLKKIGICFFAIAVPTVLLFISCSKNETQSTVFNLRMTDDPLANVQQVNIDLQRIIVFSNEGRDSFGIRHKRRYL